MKVSFIVESRFNFIQNVLYRLKVMLWKKGKEMLQERIEGKWIETFASVFKLCRVESGTVVAILSETQSRPVNVQLTELALHQLGTKLVLEWFDWNRIQIGFGKVQSLYRRFTRFCDAPDVDGFSFTRN